MKFKYSVIGDNTPDNRAWIKTIGKIMQIGYENVHDCIVTNTSNEIVHSRYNKQVDNIKDYIDCRNNPALFRAVSALREDSDIYQWFTDGVDWWYCRHESFWGFAFINNKPAITFHKATLAELQEHFKK